MTPHKCPVCVGRGEVPVGFYGDPLASTSLSDDTTCRSCKGSGVLWGFGSSPAVDRPYWPNPFGPGKPSTLPRQPWTTRSTSSPGRPPVLPPKMVRKYG